MPKWDEQTVKHHMQKELIHTPDYETMWSRIQRETNNRRSGWNRNDQPDKKPTVSRQMGKKITIIAMCTAATVSIVILSWQVAQQSTPTKMNQQASHHSELTIPHTQNDDISMDNVLPAMKNINIEAVQNGTGLRLNTGRFNFDSDGIESLTLNLSLFGIDTSTFDYASFAEGELVNAGNGSDVISALNGFDKAKNYFADETFVLNESANIMDNQQYLAKFKDLILIKHHSLKMPSNMQVGKPYTIHPGKKAIFSLQSRNWSENNRKLTIRYNLDKNITHIPDSTQFNQLQAMNKLALYKNGEPMSYSSNLSFQRNGIEQQFDFNTPITETAKKDIDFYFNYADIVQILDGQWTISFSMTE